MKAPTIAELMRAVTAGAPLSRLVIDPPGTARDAAKRGLVKAALSTHRHRWMPVFRFDAKRRERVRTPWRACACGEEEPLNRTERELRREDRILAAGAREAVRLDPIASLISGGRIESGAADES